MSRKKELIKGPYDPKKTESRIYKLWEKSGFLNPDKLKGKKTFAIVLPPPNITGSLHMGHALNATIQDILIRWKRMSGFKTLWLPGTDHAGIATQNVVEKDLKKQGITRQMLGREKFLEKVWEWREKFGNIILEQLKTIGVSCDWSRTRFTLDKDYARAVSTAFIDYHKAGWIYRAERVINWCPRCQTSLSDLELEYTEEAGKLWYIKYPLTDHRLPTTEENKKTVDRSPSTVDYITVATTRPETMLGDMAVAVNPDDERYKDLVGKKVVLPIQNREIPVIADSAVDHAFGTGAVKVTPNHDLTDFEIAKRHNLPFLQVIDERGKMTAEAGEICAGLSTSECRAKVVKELEKQGLLEKTEDYLHRLARCYRCNAVVEPLVSKQWFLKMDELARLAITAAKTGKVKFVPDRWSKVYLDWLENIRDWCVSRQIWWGHRLPVWFCKNQTGRNLKSQILSPKQIPNSKFQNSKFIENWELEIESSSTPEKFVVSVKKPKQCPFCKNCEMEQSPDVLDTWFSSALWPFATLGWPEKKIKNQKSKIKSDLEKFYPTDVLSTARDIINLWVARMVFSGMFFMRKEPFRTVYVHATVLTRAGQRMSKSLGTGINPLELVEKYGADSVRFGLIWQTMGGQDMHFSEEHILGGKKFCNKIWNAARFILMNKPPRINADLQRGFERKNKNLTKADQEILVKLAEITEETNKHLEKFEFGQALHGLYNFFWHDFCDKFIEAVKKENTIESKQILALVLNNSLKLLHPFLPFITEEIYQIIQSFYHQKVKKLLLIEKYPVK